MTDYCRECGDAVDSVGMPRSARGVLLCHNCIAIDAGWVPENLRPLFAKNKRSRQASFLKQFDLDRVDVPEDDAVVNVIKALVQIKQEDP